ncbi:toxin-antitoxin system HicB family antitoxin [Nocardioides cheoyonin]|uniref:toxin-antitoxin system HicB family antitoxin n=1 Tax=Nocardioides cheoyonin TaxID=3156615 RepID=UPI0032B410C2
MDITPYVESLRRDLLAAADAAGPEARAAAERLSYALDPAARLALMEAVSQAASEITAELPSGNVDVRLNGRELEFGVHLPPPPAPAAAPAPQPEEEDEDEGATARITLRIPESVKARAEEFAARSGSSLNTWVVNVIRAATREGSINVDVDLSSLPQFINDAMSGFDKFDPFSGTSNKRRMTGWL